MSTNEALCLFCRSRFSELPFFGCCTDCYTGDPVARAAVDEAQAPVVNAAFDAHQVQQ